MLWHDWLVLGKLLRKLVLSSAVPSLWEKPSHCAHTTDTWVFIVKLCCGECFCLCVGQWSWLLGGEKKLHYLFSNGGLVHMYTCRSKCMSSEELVYEIDASIWLITWICFWDQEGLLKLSPTVYQSRAHAYIRTCIIIGETIAAEIWLYIVYCRKYVR